MVRKTKTKKVAEKVVEEAKPKEKKEETTLRKDDKGRNVVDHGKPIVEERYGNKLKPRYGEVK